MTPEFRSWLESTDFRWLEELTSDGIPVGSVGKKEADFMVRLEAIYQAARQAVPKLEFSWSVVDELLRKLPPRGSLQRAFFDGQLEISWGGTVAEVVAAAALGRAGRLSSVLVAADLLSSGFNGEFDGDGCTVRQGYQFLVSAASYTAAEVGQRLLDVSTGPGWWFGDRDRFYSKPAKPDPFAWIANRSLTVDQRRDALNGLSGFVGNGGRLEVLLVARAVGVDESFLDSQDLLEAEQSLGLIESELEEDSLLEEDFEGYVWEMLDAGGDVLHRVGLIATHVDELIAQAAQTSAEDPESVKLLHQQNRWIHWWSLQTEYLLYSACWAEGWIDLGIRVRLNQDEPPPCWRRDCVYCSD